MKKILLISILLVTSFFGASQTIQTIGAPGTNVVGRGMVTADTALGLRRDYVDTSNANLGSYLKNNAGAIIRTGTQLWTRNQAATAWVQIGSASSVNIYNSDGTFTDNNRTLTGLGASSQLFFNAIGEFRVSGANGYSTTGLISTDGNGGTAFLGRLSDGVYFESGDSLRASGLGQKTDITVNMPVVWNTLTNSLAYGDWNSVNTDSLFGVNDNSFTAKRGVNMNGFGLALDSGKIIINAKFSSSDTLLAVRNGPVPSFWVQGNTSSGSETRTFALNFTSSNLQTQQGAGSAFSGGYARWTNGANAETYQQPLTFIRRYPSVDATPPRADGFIFTNDTLSTPVYPFMDSAVYRIMSLRFQNHSGITSDKLVFFGDGKVYAANLPYSSTVDSLVGWKNGILSSTLSSQFTITAPGNQGDIIIKNGTTFGTPASDSLRFTSSGLNVKGSITSSVLTSGRFTIAGASGVLGDDALATWTTGQGASFTGSSSGLTQPPLNVVNTNSNDGTSSFFFGSPNLGTNNTVWGFFGKSPGSLNMIAHRFTWVANSSTSNRYSIFFSGGSEVLSILGSGNIGIGVVAPASKLHVLSTTEQIRAAYDASNYFSTTVASDGGVTNNAVGSGAKFNYSDSVNVTGHFRLTTAGNKIKIATGSNASVGTATLSSGTITVSTTAVSSASLIFVTYDTPSGTLASGLSAPVGSIVDGTSFVINSLTTGGAVNTADNSTVRYWIIN